MTERSRAAIEPNRAYSIPEAAQVLGVSVQMIYKMRKRGLKVSKLGPAKNAKVVIMGWQLLDYLKSHEVAEVEE